MKKEEKSTVTLYWTQKCLEAPAEKRKTNELTHIRIGGKCSHHYAISVSENLRLNIKRKLSILVSR